MSRSIRKCARSGGKPLTWGGGFGSPSPHRRTACRTRRAAKLGPGGRAGLAVERRCTGQGWTFLSAPNRRRNASTLGLHEVQLGGRNVVVVAIRIDQLRFGGIERIGVDTAVLSERLAVAPLYSEPPLSFSLTRPRSPCCGRRGRTSCPPRSSSRAVPFFSDLAHPS